MTSETSNKLPKPAKYLIIFVLFFFLGWESASYYITVKLNHNPATANQNLSVIGALTGNQTEKADLGIFWKVWGMLSDVYVDEKALDSQQMVYGAIKGMTASLGDPYTVYMTPDETKDFDQNIAGELEGIGAELTVKDKALVVVSPIKGSPAEKAGLLPGDIVYKVDGKLTSDMTLFEAITKIRGQKGTSVTLTIVRKDQDKPFDVAITRDTVNIDSVTLDDKGKGIFAITINEFNDKTQEEFEAIVQKILLKDPKGIVLDLRFNGGGLLEGAVDILSEFIKGKKVAVTIKKRNKDDNQSLFVTGDAKLGDVPMVVLINGGSASASEIVAGALQDYKRAILMGEKSFGKGSVQEVDPLSDGSSIRITIAKWYTPNDNNIDKVGINPDIEVKANPDDLKHDKDVQMDQAVSYLGKLK